MSALFRFMGLFIPVDENAVLITSFSGKRYDDSPRVLFEAMLQRSDCRHLHFTWAFDEPDRWEVPNARKIKMDSPAYWRACLSSKYWITNVNMERGLNFKKPGTIYVNTWHGSGMKKSGNSVAGRSDYDFSRVDVLTCDGHLLERIMIDSFNARPESILLCGRPREDALFAMQKNCSVSKTKIKLGVEPDKRLLLYAPTWRDSANYGASYESKPPLDIKKWKEVLGDNVIIAVRAHSITARLSGIEFDQQVLDYSNYENLNELLFASDVLISDYSGVLMDYAILGKPMLGFVYDFDEYSRTRGLYFDPRKYISMFEDEDSLLEYLLHMDYMQEGKKARAYYERFAGFGGNATASCIDRMLELGSK